MRTCSRLFIAVLLAVLALTASNFAMAQGDVLINDPSSDVGKPSVTYGPDGNLYAAVEDLTLQWFYIYRSADGGQTWSYLWGVTGGPAGFETFNPSIAAAADYSNKTWIYVAYGARHPDNTQSVDVLRLDPTNPSGTSNIATVDSGIYMPADDIHPEVTTDSPPYTGDFWVYVTYNRRGGIDPAHQVMFSRSADRGETWSTPSVLATITEQIMPRPHITFGGPVGFPGDTFRVFVVYETGAYIGGVWRRNVTVRVSRYFGTSWDPAVQLTTDDDEEYHPRVAAALNGTSVVVVYTRNWNNSGTDLDVWYAYSTNAGVNWSTNNALSVSGAASEQSPDIHIRDTNRFHCAYWNGYDIHYRWTDDAPPTSWSSPVIVNDQTSASVVYPRPSVCVNASMSEDVEACVAWTDFRGSSPYDAYFDRADVFLCGDGVVNSSEGCDDGNKTSGDGCDATCDVESCFQCVGEPSACTCTGSCVLCTSPGTCSDAGGTCTCEVP